MKNSSYQGWLKDPQNLNIGDKIFNPVLNTWITINSLKILGNHSYTVFDVATSPLNDFIGNGILLDIKT